MGNLAVHGDHMVRARAIGKRRANRLACANGRVALAIGVILAFTLAVTDAGAQTSASSAPEGPAVQLMQPSGPGESAPAITVTLKDAFDRAQKNDPLFVNAALDAKIAQEDRLQAKSGLLPQISETTQYLNDKGNGRISDGRFVTQDGVHVYREWGVVHQDVSANTVLKTTYHRAEAAEALANAKAAIARQGLYVTVSKAFYALVVAQRKYATAQLSLDQTKHFFDITQDSERQGLTPHTDTLKAEIQYRQQQQVFDDAKLTMENARLDLAVLMFPTLNENFSVVDDLDSAQALPGFAEVQTMAGKTNPDIRAAIQTARQTELDVTAAKTAFLPSLTIDLDYGIEANCFALHCTRASFPEAGVLPNLGYFLTAAVNIPVWDWGTLRSKLHQAQYKQHQANVQLTQTQRAALSELYSSYNEATVARTAVEQSRHTAELAAESLRLVNLRYQAGESPAIEVVDAENTLITARNAYDDAQVRYRTALAKLQTLTGNF